MTLKTITAALAATLAFAPLAYADITVGLIAPLTGPVAAIGAQIKNGAETAVEEINKKGGVNGEKLVLKIVDDAGEPKQGVSAANQLIADDIRFVVGPVTSGVSIPASVAFAENGALMVTPTATSPELTARGLSTVFRTCGRDDQQADVAAKFVVEKFKDKKIAILNDLTPGSRNLAAATKENLNRIGINETLATAFTATDADDAALADRLKEAGIAVAYYGGDAREMGRLVRISAERGFKPQWFGTSAIATQEFATIAGPASNGVLMTFYLDPRRKPEAAAVVAAFKAEGVEPEGSTIYGYAALQALVAAGNFAHSQDSKRLAATLHAERFDLVLGSVGFDAKGDVTAQGYVLYVWSDGTFSYAK